MEYFGIWLIVLLVVLVLKEGFTTETEKAGKCEPTQIYKEMTLKGGINAGTYKDVGGVKTMEECQQKCCKFSACDLAFMLAGSCYLVGCKDQKQCQMQPAKESSFKPMISYVTRWNNEGVKHTVIAREKEKEYTCPKMHAIGKVTLKGGLQAGDFTDIGRVGSMGDCYNTCCQQEKCDLAFMLGQNCFTVVCKDKRMCVTTNAQPSIFNPQIAYVTKRVLASAKQKKDALPQTGTCPDTRVLDNMTLKGGVDAGAYKDHGKVKDMSLCRRICCEMTDCHLAFMLGETCFSVKCSTMDACRAQKAKPSTYSPKISYVRKVNTNELLPSYNAAASVVTPATTATTGTTLTPETVGLGNMIKPEKPVESTNSIALKNKNQAPSAALSVLENLAKEQSSVSTTVVPTTTASTTSTTTTVSQTANDLLSALQKADTSSENAVVKSITECKPGDVKYNVTLKGGRKSGEFVEQKDVKNMKECSEKCCHDANGKCNLAFMLGSTCYSVQCTEKDLCRTIKAPPTKFNPIIQYVRGLDDLKEAESSLAKDQQPTTTTTIATETTTPEATTTTTPLQPVCRSQPVVRGKSIRGGKRAGKFKIFRAIKSLDSCITKCCSMKNDCDVAYMEDGNCYSIQCFKKSACMAIPLRDSDVDPTFAYMDHFLDKVDEEEAVAVESDVTTELEQSEPEACPNVEIIKNKTLKGGTKAGKFHPLGKKSMKNCISSCCDRPHCDVAYLLNGHCYSVQCTESKLCQSSDHVKHGDSVELAYMNKAESNEKKRDFLVVYVIIGMVVLASVMGGIIWVVFAYKRKQKIEETHTRLLEPEDEEETIDNIMHKKPSSRSRYRQSRY